MKYKTLEFDVLKVKKFLLLRMFQETFLFCQLSSSFEEKTSLLFNQIISMTNSIPFAFVEITPGQRIHDKFCKLFDICWKCVRYLYSICEL